jgi:branched-chain amino acid transport system permease protein
MSRNRYRSEPASTVAAVSLALQILVTGLAAGGTYGLVAVGYSLIYRLTGIVHLAYGDLLGLGVFATLLFAAGTQPVARATAAEPRFALALAAAVVLAFAVGAATYLYAVQPYVAKGSTIGWVAALLAVAFAIHAVLGAVFTRSSYVFPDALPFDRIGDAGIVRLGGASLQVRSFFVIGVALALASIASLVLERTRFGTGLRAIASDREGAEIVGVPVERSIALAFGAAGALAVIAAVVAAPTTAIGVDTGTLLGVKGLAAAVVVRFGPPLHAMAAGLVLGLVEATIANAHAGGLELGPAYREVVPLLAVLVLLMLRPHAEAVEERD